MVTLRAELLRRFGQVPETAQELRAAWQPLVAGERARTDYAAWPLDEAGLQKADPEGAHPEWKEVLAACLAPAGQAARLLRAREEILRRPLRPAVAYLLPRCWTRRRRCSRRAAQRSACGRWAVCACSGRTMRRWRSRARPRRSAWSSRARGPRSGTFPARRRSPSPLTGRRARRA